MLEIGATVFDDWTVDKKSVQVHLEPFIELKNRILAIFIMPQ